VELHSSRRDQHSCRVCLLQPLVDKGCVNKPQLTQLKKLSQSANKAGDPQGGGVELTGHSRLIALSAVTGLIGRHTLSSRRGGLRTDVIAAASALDLSIKHDCISKALKQAPRHRPTPKANFHAYQQSRAFIILN
jgi:hypothetical protein